jgi:hypothetical protein
MQKEMILKQIYLKYIRKMESLLMIMGKSFQQMDFRLMQKISLKSY